MKIGILAASAALFALPVAAQDNCAVRANIVASLSGKFGEARVGMGARQFVHGRGVMEIWANPETGSWSHTITYSNGMTCLVSSGRDWVALNEVPPESAPAPGEDM